MNASRNPMVVYIVIAAGLWLSTIYAITSILKGTPYIVQVLPILLGEAVVFVVLIPLAFSIRRRR